MRRFLNTHSIAALLFVAVIALCACSEDDKHIYQKDPDQGKQAGLQLTSSSGDIILPGDGTGTIRFTAEGGDAVIAVKVNTERWTVKNHSPLIFAAIQKDGTLTIKAVENASLEQLSGSLTVSAGFGEKKEQVEISIVQMGKDQAQIDVSSESTLVTLKDFENADISFPDTGGEAVVAISTNQQDWEFEQAPGQTWLTVVKRGSDLVFTADDNPTTYDNDGVVTVSAGAEYNRAVFVFTLAQTAKEPATLQLNPKDVILLPKGETVQVAVVTNQQEWEFNCDDPWVTMEKGDGVINITASKNNTGEQLKATISITAGTPSNFITADINVSQEPMDNRMIVTLTISNTTVRLPVTGAGLNCVVDWGDGSEPETVTTAYPSHVYAQAGTYDVAISGIVPQINANNASNFPVVQRRNIVAVKQWGALEGLNSMQAAFYQCANLTSLPEETGDAFSYVTTFMQTFYQCTGLKTLPADIFASAKGCLSFRYTFSGCNALETIPAGLFDNNSGADNFQDCFKDSAITSIPAGLFDSITGTVTFASVFSGCKNLTSIPAGLFNKCVGATTFASAFMNVPITTIPAGLFKNNSKAYAFASVFSGTAITSVPAGLFDALDNSQTINLSSVFKGCASLETIPAGLFDKCISAASFANTFENCAKLEAIPAGLFDKNVNATNFMTTFSGCNVLTSIPTTLFDNCTKVFNFKNTFQNCTALTGESPYSAVEIGGTPTKIHLYERNEHPTLFTTVTQIGAAYKGCTQLSDYPYMVSNYVAWTK